MFKNHLNPALGDVPLTALTREQLRDVLAAKAKAGLSRATLQNLTITLRSIVERRRRRRQTRRQPGRPTRALLSERLAESAEAFKPPAGGGGHLSHPRIQGGDLLVEIETDAVDVDLEAAGAEVLRAILVPAGDTVLAGALLGLIAEPGDDFAAPLPTTDTPGGAAGARTREEPENRVRRTRRGAKPPEKAHVRL